MNDQQIPVLYEDEDTLVIDKPSGMLSEDSPTAPSVVRTLLAHTGGTFLAPVTRLDREVSGVMLLAKTREGAAYYSTAMAERKWFEKEYRTVVSGRLAEPSGEMHDLLFKDSARGKSYVVGRMRRGVKRASLAYEVLAEREEEGRFLSLLRILLHTGRTHQIRVQTSSRRHPIVGDRKYGGDGAYPMGLVAFRLTFQTRKGRTVTCTSARISDAPFSLFARETAENVRKGEK